MAKILYCDHQSVFNRTIMQNTLAKYGYEVFIAKTDEEMIEIVKKEMPDMVIYSIVASYSPNTFSEIKEIHPECKITVAIANLQPSTFFLLKRYGVDYPFITKPLNEWQIVDVLDHFLPGTRKDVPLVLKPENFTKFEYRPNTNGVVSSPNDDVLFFKYDGNNFFTKISYEEGKITKIIITHNADSMFRCPACGTNHEDYGECPTFADIQDDVLEIVFNDPSIKEQCSDVILKWKEFRA